ncbi:MAG: hypothetical protein K1X81_09855 [Bacteroidia bacterium]|nr:hypothetical protein [Bacteroidia bacterium]
MKTIYTRVANARELRSEEYGKFWNALDANGEFDSKIEDLLYRGKEIKVDLDKNPETPDEKVKVEPDSKLEGEAVFFKDIDKLVGVDDMVKGVLLVNATNKNKKDLTKLVLGSIAANSNKRQN